MSQQLTYPRLSVVFIQTFSIHHTKEFILPEDAVKYTDVDYKVKNDSNTIYYEKADALSTPIVLVKKTDIEQLIFSLPDNSPYESPRRVVKKCFRKPRIIPQKGNVRRYSLRGFDFTMPIEKQDASDPIDPVTLWGHCNVELNLFFGHVASITYRFLFDGNRCFLKKPINTDHIIIFLSSWLNAEHWSPDEDDKGITTIEYQTHFHVDKIWLTEEGDERQIPEEFDVMEKGRSFDAVAIRYKNYLYKHCTQFKPEISRSDQKKWLEKWEKYPLNLERDLRYAMVDIWEDLQHINEDGTDLFLDKKKGGVLDEVQIINHIRNYHKSELVGLLSLYPKEWRYRDPEAFDDVCGENIAIDTDDLVLAGNSMCVVIGTYGRRGEGVAGTNWEKHLQERAHYHVSWPEYLLIVQMILAKKYVIELATNEMIESTVQVEINGAEERLIKENAELSMRLNRLVTQLDILKYARYPAHKVMYNRTSRRLGLKESYERLNTIMENIDNSMHNIAEYRSMRSDFFLNIVLAFISVAATFELLFQDSSLPFINRLFCMADSSLPAAILVFLIATATVFAILYVFVHYTIKVISRIRSKHND